MATSLFTYFPMTPPNFDGDVAYATVIAKKMAAYSNPEAFGHRCSANDLDEAFMCFQDRNEFRSCSVGDIIYRSDTHTYWMVQDLGFIELKW